MSDEPIHLEKHLQIAVEWIRTHQERFWSITGTAAVAVILVVFAVHRRQQENAQAWTVLGIVHGQLVQGKYDDAKKGIGQWEEHYKSTSADGYERFIKADLLYKTSDYAQAAQIYGGLSQDAPSAEMKPLALSAQESAAEMAGQLPQALAAANEFIDKYPDHFLASRAFLAKARLSEMQGNSVAAVAAYDRFITLYPQHPMAAVAKARRQALGGSPAVPSSAPSAATLPPAAPLH